jgi:hypothetical protein
MSQQPITETAKRKNPNAEGQSTVTEENKCAQMM